MVSLTSLLVLATFFTQTSQSIPKTSYLKLIDVWFVALIFEDFAIILSLVYVETLRLKKEPGPALRMIRVSPISNDEEKMSSSSSSSFFSSFNIPFHLLPDGPAEVNRYLINFFSSSIVIMLLCFIPTCIYGMYVE